MKNKPIQIWQAMATFLGIIAVPLNSVLSVKTEGSVGILFLLAYLIIIIYGLLCCHGYVKKIASIDDLGEVEYKTAVPIVQIGIFRIIELGWYYWRAELLLRNVLILIIIDLAFLVCMLIDKSTYVYKSKADTELL